jgi:ethanolamine ammonia-lyase small subunit
VSNASPLVPDPWAALRQFTAARIASGRAGGSLPTAEVLKFGLDHAVARDAVHSVLNLDALEAAIARMGLPVVRVRSAAPDRLTYLQRPDLGRRLEESSGARLTQMAENFDRAPDVAIIVADGLSATAVQSHAAAVLALLVPKLRAAKLEIAPIVLARLGRVALQDDVGASLRARCALILLGERPGLGAADSLGAYFVYDPRVGKTDADRNCVSNIRPSGLPLAAAADTIEYLITQSLQRGISGTALKDERVSLPLPGIPARVSCAPAGC